MTTLQLISTIAGYIAGISMILGYLPQAITTIRTRNTEGISLTAWVWMAIGAVFFIINGFTNGIAALPIAFTNMITGTCSVIVVVIKIKNDRRKKQGQES